VIERLEDEAAEEVANAELLESLAEEEADLKRKRTGSSPVGMEAESKPRPAEKKSKIGPEVVMVRRTTTKDAGDRKGKAKATEMDEGPRERRKRAKQDWSTVPDNAVEVCESFDYAVCTDFAARRQNVARIVKTSLGRSLKMSCGATSSETSGNALSASGTRKDVLWRAG